MQKKVAVIGAGISGLRALHCLIENADDAEFSEVYLYEQSSKIGGVVQSIQENGYTLDLGANGVLLQRESFMKTLKALKIVSDIILPHSKAKTRFLLTLTSAIPLSPNIFRLVNHGILKCSDVLRIMKEPFVKKPEKVNPKETVFDFFKRRFGENFARAFVIPAATGIWGGGAKDILVRFAFPTLPYLEQKNGSLVSALLARGLKNVLKKQKSPKGLANFKSGMAELPHRLLEETKKLCREKNIKFKQVFDCTVSAVSKADFDDRIILMSSKGEEHFDSVIVAIPPWKSGVKFGDHDEEKTATDVLKNISTHDLVVVGIGGEDVSLRYPSGFGGIAGEWSNDLLGVIFVHSLYPEHVPHGRFLYKALIGGDRLRNASELSDTELLALTKKHLMKYGFLSESSRFEMQKVKRWPQCVPLAKSDHTEVLKAVWILEAHNPGLFFAGNFLFGVGFADCLESGERAGKNALKYVRRLNENF